MITGGTGIYRGVTGEWHFVTVEGVGHVTFKFNARRAVGGGDKIHRLVVDFGPPTQTSPTNCDALAVGESFTHKASLFAEGEAPDGVPIANFWSVRTKVDNPCVALGQIWMRFPDRGDLHLAATSITEARAIIGGTGEFVGARGECVSW